jgi:hypothetical protein
MYLMELRTELLTSGEAKRVGGGIVGDVDMAGKVVDMFSRRMRLGVKGSGRGEWWVGSRSIWRYVYIPSIGVG